MFLKYYNQTNFGDPTSSRTNVIPISKVRTTAILVLLIVGN
jgi:hypothetical protein